MRILLQFSCRCCAPSQPPLCDLHVSTCRRLSRSCIQSPLKFVCLSRRASSSAEFGRSALSPGTADEAENSARNSCCPKQSVQSLPMNITHLVQIGLISSSTASAAPQSTLLSSLVACRDRLLRPYGSCVSQVGSRREPMYILHSSVPKTKVTRSKQAQHRHP